MPRRNLAPRMRVITQSGSQNQSSTACANTLARAIRRGGYRHCRAIILIFRTSKVHCLDSHATDGTILIHGPRSLYQIEVFDIRLFHQMTLLWIYHV